VKKITLERSKNDSIFDDLMYLKKKTAPLFYQDFGKDLNFTVDDVDNQLPFTYVAHFGDIVRAERFESIPQSVNWTEAEMSDIYTMLNACLLRPFD